MVLLNQTIRQFSKTKKPDLANKHTGGVSMGRVRGELCLSGIAEAVGSIGFVATICPCREIVWSLIGRILWCLKNKL